MNNAMVISEIEKHIEIINNLDEMETFMPSQGIKSREIINSERYSSFFRETDVDKLLASYTEVISETAEQLGIGGVTDKQFIINVLEYGRFLGMYENMSNQKDGEFGAMSNVSCLSQSGLNIALLGKGVCASQARFMRDLLQAHNIEAVCSNVTFVEDEIEQVPIDEHDVTLFGLDSKYYYADPTWYNGMSASLKGSNGLVKCYQYPDLEVNIPEFSQEEIETARRTAAQVAIKKLGIGEIAEQLGLYKLSDLDKQATIMAYLEKQAITQRQPVSVASVDINGFEVEVGKAFELFLQQQKVPYQLHNQSRGDKRQNILSLEVLGQPTALATKDIINVTNNKLSQRLHLIQTQDGKWEYLPKTSEDIMKQYRESITNARQRVEQLNIGINLKEDKANKLANTIQTAENLQVEIELISKQIAEYQQSETITDRSTEEQEGQSIE